MEFSTALIDLLLLNPEGLTDKRVQELGRECGLKPEQARKVRTAMCRVRILGFEYGGKIGDRSTLIWKLREPRKPRGKDVKKRKAYKRRVGRSKRAK